MMMLLFKVVRGKKRIFYLHCLCFINRETKALSSFNCSRFTVRGGRGGVRRSSRLKTHVCCSPSVGLCKKNNEIMPFVATWMDLVIIIVSEVSQTKANVRWYYLYMESKWYKWAYLQYRLTDIESNLMVTKREGGRDKLGV